MPSKQLHNEVLAGGSETAKHHGPKGRNDLNQSQEQVSWGPECPFWNPTRNPLLACYRARILSYPAILLSS